MVDTLGSKREFLFSFDKKSIFNFFSDKIVPNLVGVDIGCRMETLCIKADSEVSRNFNGAELDKIIRINIPSGFSIRKFPHAFVEQVEWDNIKEHYNKKRTWLNLGTLGGGTTLLKLTVMMKVTCISLFILTAATQASK